VTHYLDLDSMRAARAAALQDRPLTKRDITIGGPEIRYRSYERVSDADTNTSITQQRVSSDKHAGDHGWTRIPGEYADNDRPASRRARKGSRERYEQLLQDIAEDPGHVLVFFEMARGSRDMAVYIKLRDFCTENGPYFWYVGTSLYDVRDASDRQTLNNLASQAEGGSDNISRAVSPAMGQRAEMGRPHAGVPFGYRRLYDSSTANREPIGQEFDDDMTGRDWCPADIVREIFDTYHSAGSLITLADKYNQRGIPCPLRYAALRSGNPERIAKTEHLRWTQRGFRFILKNAHYVGVRMHKGVLASEETMWKPLVDREVFFAVQRRRAELARTGSVPTRAQTLLTCLASCFCGENVFHHPTKGVYLCERGNASVPRALADEHVEESVIGFFETPGVAERVQPDDSEERRVAADRAAKIREDLDGWRKVAQNPLRTDYGLADYNAYAETVLPELQRLEKEATRTEISPTVQKMLGSDPRASWEDLSLPQKRELLSMFWRIEIHPVGKGRGKSVPVDKRVTMTLIF
jgi:site-specific DNA recombinase